MLIIGGALVAAFVVVVVAGAVFVASVASNVPPLSQLRVTTYGQASTVYAADGSVLGLLKGTVLR